MIQTSSQVWPCTSSLYAYTMFYLTGVPDTKNTKNHVGIAFFDLYVREISLNIET